MFRRQLLTGLLMTVVMTILLGFAYPFAVSAVSQGLMGNRAGGSFVKQDGKIVGSSLLGQNFTDKDGNPLPQYFQPRPSAAGKGYDALSSAASNLGPSNQDLLDAIAKRTTAYRKVNGLAKNARVPVDAVTASGSGLDPAISPANARLQAARVAKERGVPVDQVLALIDQHTDDRQLRFLGEKRVNVLELNLALDRLH